MSSTAVAPQLANDWRERAPSCVAVARIAQEHRRELRSGSANDQAREGTKNRSKRRASEPNNGTSAIDDPEHPRSGRATPASRTTGLILRRFLKGGTLPARRIR